MKRFKRVELYDTFTMDHPITGAVIRVQAIEGNNVISCRECLFRQKGFEKICPLMRCLDMSTGKSQAYKQVKL